MPLSDLRKLTDEKWVNLYAVRYERGDHASRWVFASRKEKPLTGELVSDAVLIVPVLRNPGEPPRLVLVREFRVPVGRQVYGLPAGLLEPGETIEDTVRRELREETGLELASIERVSPPLLSSSGLTDEAAAMAFVTARGTPGSGEHLEPGEDIEVVLLDLAGIRALCDDPIWIDAKAWLVLLMYRQLGRLD